MLIAVDNMGLQRGVNLAEAHRRRVQPHSLHGIDVNVRFDGADLQIQRFCLVEIGESILLADRAHAAIAKGDAIGKNAHAGSIQKALGKLCADFTVQNAGHLVVVLPDICQI